MKTICLLILLQWTAQAESFQAPSNLHTINKISGIQKYTVRLIEISSDTYGYEIYADNKIFIRQITIPGVQGNKGFKRKADALKIAKLVVTKLSNGIMPPTVEKQELDKLQIQY